MSRADYAHHNEEADRIWWQEEGKHSVHVDHYDEDLDDDHEREERGDTEYEEEDRETETDNRSS